MRLPNIGDEVYRLPLDRYNSNYPRLPCRKRLKAASVRCRRARAAVPFDAAEGEGQRTPLIPVMLQALAYWPFHKSACRRNDFADAIEQQEPQFAAWMRKHGKLAVMQDDEVDRLERSSRPGGWLGLGRQDVMDSMYGRIDPRPAAPTYDIPAALAAAQQLQHFEVAADPFNSSDKAWHEIEVPAGLGLTATRFKWRQNLSHIEVFVRLPDSVQPKQVCVQLTPDRVAVSAAGDVLLTGQLARAIKVEHSTWYCDAGIVHMQLLKRNRRGHYSNGTTAADTFWFSLLAAAQGADRLPGHPPTCYYSSAYEADDLALQ